MMVSNNQVMLTTNNKENINMETNVTKTEVKVPAIPVATKVTTFSLEDVKAGKVNIPMRNGKNTGKSANIRGKANEIMKKKGDTVLFAELKRYIFGEIDDKKNYRGNYVYMR